MVEKVRGHSTQPQNHLLRGGVLNNWAKGNMGRGVKISFQEIRGGKEVSKVDNLKESGKGGGGVWEGTTTKALLEIVLREEKMGGRGRGGGEEEACKNGGKMNLCCCKV